MVIAETPLTWSSASSQTCSVNATYYPSDPFSFNANTVAATIAVSAAYAGAASAGDVANFYLAYTSGDLMGDTGDDYDTDKHAVYLGSIDLTLDNTARRTLTIPSAVPKGAKLLCNCPAAATHNIVVRARLTEQRTV